MDEQIKEKEEDMVEVVIFTLDNEEYAVSVFDVREVIEIPDITPVPNSPEFVLGLINLRGKIISVNFTDGIRIVFGNNDVAHIRPSGNAPEFRMYATADTQDRANEIVRTRNKIIPAMVADMQKTAGGNQTANTRPFVAAEARSDRVSLRSRGSLTIQAHMTMPRTA